jgi:hypothetical protein
VVDMAMGWAVRGSSQRLVVGSRGALEEDSFVADDLAMLLGEVHFAAVVTKCGDGYQRVGG